MTRRTARTIDNSKPDPIIEVEPASPEKSRETRAEKVMPLAVVPEGVP